MEKLYVRQKCLSIHESRRQQFYNLRHVSRNHCKQIGHFNQSSLHSSFLICGGAMHRLISFQPTFNSPLQHIHKWVTMSMFGHGMVLGRLTIEELESHMLVFIPLPFNLVYDQGIWDCG